MMNWVSDIEYKVRIGNLIFHAEFLFCYVLDRGNIVAIEVECKWKNAVAMVMHVRQYKTGRNTDIKINCMYQ